MASSAQKDSNRMPRFAEVMDCMVLSYLQKKKYHKAAAGLIADSMPLNAKYTEAKRTGDEIKIVSRIRHYNLEEIVQKFYVVGIGFPSHIYSAIEALGTITETMMNFARISAPRTELEDFPFFAAGREHPRPETWSRPPHYGNDSCDVDDLFSESQHTITLESDTEDDIEQDYTTMDGIKSHANNDQFLFKDNELPVEREEVLELGNEEKADDDPCGKLTNWQNREEKPRTPGGASIREADDDIVIMPLSDSGLIEGFVGAVPTCSAESLNFCVSEIDDGGPIRTPGYYGSEDKNEHRNEEIDKKQGVLQEHFTDLTPRTRSRSCSKEDSSDVIVKPTPDAQDNRDAPEPFFGKVSVVDLNSNTSMLNVEQVTQLDMPEIILEESEIPDLGSVQNKLADAPKETTKAEVISRDDCINTATVAQESVTAATATINPLPPQVQRRRKRGTAVVPIITAKKNYSATVPAIVGRISLESAQAEEPKPSCGVVSPLLTPPTEPSTDSGSGLAEVVQEQVPAQQLKPDKLVIQMKPTATSLSFKHSFLQAANGHPLADYKIPKKTHEEAFQKVISIHREVPAKDNEVVERKIIETASASSSRARTSRFPQRAPYRGHSRTPVREIKPKTAHSRRANERETRVRESSRSRSSRRGAENRDGDTKQHDRDHGYNSPATNSSRRSSRIRRNRNRSPPSTSRGDGNSRRNRR